MKLIWKKEETENEIDESLRHFHILQFNQMQIIEEKIRKHIQDQSLSYPILKLKKL